MLKANRYHPLPSVPVQETKIDRAALDATIKAIHDQWVAKHLAKK